MQDIVGSISMIVAFITAVLLLIRPGVVGRLLEAFWTIGRLLFKPSGCYIQPSMDKIISVNSEPTGLFLIDERCPGCLGTGRLRVNILEDDIDEERMWRELELAATKEWDWQVARTCTGCGLPFLCSKKALRDFCGEGDCQHAYYNRGKRTLGILVDLDVTTHGDQQPQTMKGYVTQ